MDPPALERLGHHVVGRRVALGYRNRTDLADSLQFTIRTLADVEHGVRKPSPGTYAILENKLASERSVVEWHADRQRDDNPGLFFVANTGEDPAYEVRVVAGDGTDRVEASAPLLVPYRVDRDPATRDDYIQFQLPNRESRGAEPIPGPGPRVPTPEPPPGLRDYLAEIAQLDDAMIAAQIDRLERKQVWVRVTWRSELGRWSTEELHTG